MEEERNYTVYMHVNKANGKTYIGITSKKPEKRWNNGNGYKQNKYFDNAIKKHTWDGFEHIILFENKTREEAEKLEVLFIRILLSNNRTYGYNITNGGESTGKFTKETKEKISKNSAMARKVICDNKIFNSITDCARYYNVDSNNMGSWLRGSVGAPVDFVELGLRFDKEEVVKQKKLYKRKVICENKTFDCIRNCAEYYNINTETMRNWLKGKNSMRQDFYDKGLRYLNFDSNIEPENKEYNCKKVICDDIIFDSITLCSDYYNVKMSNMSSWLSNKTSTPQEFINLGLRYLGEDISIYKSEFMNSKRAIICDEKIFKTTTACAEYYNINKKTMQGWITCKNPMPQQFIDLNLRFLNDNKTIYEPQVEKVKRKIICNNIIFDSIKDCSDYFNINYSTMMNWLRNKNPMPQEYIDLGLNYYIEK